MKKLISNLLVTMSVLAAAWVVGSWGEVVLKNVEPNPNYSNLNLLVQIVKLAE